MTFPCSPDARLAPWRTAGWLVATATGVLVGLTGFEMGSLALCLAGLAAGIAAGAGLWTVRTIRYEIRELDLVVHYGFVTRRIPLECIEGAAPASRRVAGFPRVLEYLTLVYREGEHDRALHLYPDDAQGLLDALVEQAPFLERHGDGVVRTPALVGSP